MEQTVPCKNKAKYKLTWPGTDERFVCKRHANQFRGIAKAMGFHLQIIPLDADLDRDCAQKEN